MKNHHADVAGQRESERIIIILTVTVVFVVPIWVQLASIF